MGYPLFNVGDDFTSSDANAIGLWRITNCTVTSVGGTAATASNGVVTVGTNNTSVTVNNAFSADYDNYLIQYNGIDGTVATNLTMTLGSANTGYAYALNYNVLPSNTVVGFVAQNVSSWVYAGVISTDESAGTIELWNPFLTRRTAIRSTYIEFVTSGSLGQLTGFLNNATSYTSFTLTAGAGSMTGGTIRVYGYRR